MGEEGETAIQDQKGHQRYPCEVGGSGQSILAVYQSVLMQGRGGGCGVHLRGD